MSDDLKSYWDDLKPSTIPGATLSEEELFGVVQKHWETFVLAGDRWSKHTSKMAVSGDRIIREHCPGIPDEDVTILLKRFFYRFGVPGVY